MVTMPYISLEVEMVLNEAADEGESMTRPSPICYRSRTILFDI
jgi:hypothetical protein